MQNKIRKHKTISDFNQIVKKQLPFKTLILTRGRIRGAS